MNRVSHRNPCPICGKPDWCLYSPEGDAAICTRISEGSIKKCKGDIVQWLHVIKEGFKPKPIKKRQPININWNTLQSCYINAFIKIPHNPFSVSNNTMRVIYTGWDGEAYTFPVRNANDEIIGITRRWPDGTKGMVKGSQVGIYIPRISWDNLETLFICEGASDTATALDMDLFAIGRVSCQTGRDHIIKWCVQKKPTQIVIVADNDTPGITGAKILGADISHGYKLFVATCPTIKVITPPTGVKDLREWRQNGLTHEELIQISNENLDFPN